jgi:predicted ATPase
LLAAIRVHKYRRDGQALPTLSADLLALATAQGFTMRAASGMIEQGWMRVQRGEGAEGIRQMQHGLANARATGSALGQAYQLASLAEAYGRVGQVDAGLHTLAEAQTVVRTQEEHFYEAEVYRLTGEFLWARAAAEHAEVEGALRQALAIARRQEAKSLELRAAMSLSRLWQQQGKRAEARELLAPIYGWFTEGFDTADLKEAKALLEELAG